MREFKRIDGPWSRYAPLGFRKAASMPTPVDLYTRGRIELCIGRLGTGKTTWAAMRSRRLANATGRALATTGESWPEPWQCITSFEGLFALRDTVVVLDELHLMLPSSKGLLGADVERSMLRWLSLARKRGVCVVGTTQAWTRVATHYRQLVTTVWLCEAERPGKVHIATPCCPPEEGGVQILPRQYYDPKAAKIPTTAAVWMPYEIIGDDTGLAVGIGRQADRFTRRAAPRPARAVGQGWGFDPGSEEDDVTE